MWGGESSFYLLVDSGNEKFFRRWKVYFKSDKVYIELYTDEKDFELEERVEAALDAADLFWQKSEQYIKSENMYEVLYEVEG